MKNEEWGFNSSLSNLLKKTVEELDFEDFDDEKNETEDEMNFVAVKSVTIYHGGVKEPTNSPIKIYCNAPIGNINTDFDNNF